MSDVEHQLIADVTELHATARRLGEVARRALDALRVVQDSAAGSHEPWIDAASGDVSRALRELSSRADT